MIKSISVKNFKSIVDLKLDLGRFNVLIGENGCGKTNILEAIAFGAAASADKLDFEFLGSRGLRVPKPEHMYSAFEKRNRNNNEIKLQFEVENDLFDEFEYALFSPKNNPKNWERRSKTIGGSSDSSRLTVEILSKNSSKLEKIEKLNEKLNLNDEMIDFFSKLIDELDNDLSQLNDKLPKEKIDKENQAQIDQIIKQRFVRHAFNNYSDETISNYINYSPEETSLRKFEDTTQIYPIGIKGEGLFQYLKHLSNTTGNKRTLKAIKKNLSFIDWYDKFEIPTNLTSNEFSLQIKDKYLHNSINYFDQRSSNEGFLFLLFYSTLFISKETPKFFGIDNIDMSFNPKLCMELTRNLTALAKKYEKQVIVTTHSPSVLDGLDLSDDEQRLFVVRRNQYGHTRIKRIKYKENRRLKLSEIWERGFIGGLPENF